MIYALVWTYYFEDAYRAEALIALSLDRTKLEKIVTEIDRKEHPYLDIVFVHLDTILNLGGFLSPNSHWNDNETPESNGMA